jgi:hypothetical protein
MISVIPYWHIPEGGLIAFRSILRSARAALFLGVAVCSGCASQGGGDGTDLAVILAATAPLAPAAIAYDALRRGPTPTVDYNAPGFEISRIVFDNGRNSGKAGWIDDQRFVVWGLVGLPRIWSLQGAQNAFYLRAPEGFENAVIWGVGGEELFMRPGIGDAKRDRLAGRSLASDSTREIPLPGCDGRSQNTDGGLSADGTVAYCLAAGDRDFLTVSTWTGAVVERRTLPAAAPGLAVPRAIGLTGDFHPLAGSSDGTVEWSNAEGQWRLVRLPGEIREVSGIPKTTLLVVLYRASAKNGQPHIAMLDSSTGQQIVDQTIGNEMVGTVVPSADGTLFALKSPLAVWMFSVENHTMVKIAVIGIGSKYHLEGVSFSPDGKKMVVVGTGKVAIFDIKRTPAK